MAAKIRHANILPLHSMHQGRETPIVLSQDAVDHESLTHVLARRRTLAPPHAMLIAKQIALACEEAARQGVVHGWLRPDIILLNADSQILVDEFGVPKHHHYLVRELSGASAATEYYLAPEHLREETRSDIRSDMFMLGALLFRMLTGEGLVTGYTCHEALHKASAQGCRRARTALPNLSRDLDNFVASLTAIDRDARFETWKQVIDLCERFGGGAKQQTFRLTQTQQRQTGTIRRPAPQRTHPTGSHMRGPTQSIARPQTGSFGHGTGSHGRSPSGDRNALGRNTASYQRKDKGSGGFLIVLLILLLAAGGVIFYLMGRPQARPATTTPDPAPLIVPKPPAARQAPPVTATPTPPAVAPAPTTTTPAPTTTAPGPEEAPHAQRMPGFMGGGPPVTTMPGPTTVTPTPVPPPPVEAPTMSDDEFARIRLQINDAVRAERFRAALDLCETLPVDTRQALSADIFARHQARRAEVAALAKQDPATARRLLETALATWNMPGDAEWAQGLLKDLPAGGAAAPNTSGAGSTPDNDPARISWQVTKHLLAWSEPLAEQALTSLPDGEDRRALQQRIALWRDRVAILQPAIAEKRRLLRITNPQDGQGWDVIGIEAGGLAITSSTGSTTRMDWTLLPIKEFARITMEVSAARKVPDPRESALAIVLLTAADDVALAQVHLNRSRSAFDDALATAMDRSIALHKAYVVRSLVARADEALTKGDLKVATEIVTTLRRQRSDPSAAAELPRLEEALANLQAGKPVGPAAAPLRDMLTFDAEGDLDSLPLREGTWVVQGGSLMPQGPSGSLSRKDLATVKSVTVRFQTHANRGALSFNIRDVRILIDLQAQKMTASTRDTELKPVDVQIIPRTLQTLYVELRNDGNVLVELNNGVVNLDLRLQKAGDGLTIGHDTGAAWALDELALAREVQLDAAAEAERIAAIRAIGFDPIGRATLVPPAIHLPASTPRSGIAFTRRDGVASITIEAKGTGKLEVRFGKVGEGGGQSVQLDLGKTADEAVVYTIGCGGRNITIHRGGPDGEVIIDDRLQGDPPQLIILAQQEAVITQTPRLNRN